MHVICIRIHHIDSSTNLPCWALPVRPGLLTKHFVPFQARLVGLPEGIAGPPHSDVLQETQVPDLVTYQPLAEDVCRLLIIRFDTPTRVQRFWVLHLILRT